MKKVFLPVRTERVFRILLFVCAAALLAGKGGRSQALEGVTMENGFVAIAAGYYHRIALKSDGTVVGLNDHGSAVAEATPTGLSNVVAIAAGGYEDGDSFLGLGYQGASMALKSDGTVVVWGGWVSSVPANLNNIKAIATSGFNAVVLKTDGSVIAWGVLDDSDTPAEARSGVIAVAAAAYHTVALKEDGAVLTWGNYSGLIPIEARSGVKAIAAAPYHTAALKDNGSVVTWTGSGIAMPTPPAAQSGVIAISAGEDRTAALKNDGTVVEWGINVEAEARIINAPTAAAISVGGGYFHEPWGSSGGWYNGVQTWILPGPQLEIRPLDLSGADRCVFSWTTNATGFRLESTVDLKAPATWVDSPNTPALSGSKFTVSEPIGVGEKWFRLRKL